MKLFNQKLKLIDKNYPLTLPPWIILGGQVASGIFILTEVTLVVWFCLKHRKRMTTLLKLGFTLTKKIQKDPKIIEHFVQQAEGLITTNTLPDPPPRPPSTSTRHAASVSKSNTDECTINIPSTSTGMPSPSLQSKSHCCTLEFITEAAQELYAKGQLHIKSYAGYLREKCKNICTTEDEL